MDLPMGYLLNGFRCLGIRILPLTADVALQVVAKGLAVIEQRPGRRLQALLVHAGVRNSNLTQDALTRPSTVTELI